MLLLPVLCYDDGCSLLRGVNMSQAKVLIIAGPNGAGKTTFARNYLPQEAVCTKFINADLIAAGLSPFAPEQAALPAARIMLQAINTAAERMESFAIETTLSGRVYINRIHHWRAMGYTVKLVFLSIASADLAVDRVAQRVSQGGHAIPEEVIRRRFAAGLRYFESYYKPIVDTWMHFDNTGSAPILLDWRES